MPEVPYPYDVLDKYGVRPNSPVRAVQNLNFVPSRRDESEAWRVLCNLRSRLKADFFLYQARDGDRVANFQRLLNSVQQCPSAEEILDLFGRDAPIILLLMGCRHEARQTLEQWQRELPGEGRIAHQLALLCYADAQHYEEAGDTDRATEAWYRAIANWTRTLSDDVYWDAWCLQRQACYGKRPVDYLSSDLKAAVRSDLQKHLAVEFSDYAEFYWRQQNPQQTATHRELETAYVIERQGAKALETVGGLTLDNGQTLICGALLLGRLGLESLLGDLVAKAQRLLDNYQALDLIDALEPGKEPRVPSDAVEQLRFYFSQLAMAATLISLDKPEQAISVLPSVPQVEADFDRQNPVYSRLENKTKLFHRDLAVLAVRSHVAMARREITSPSPNLSSAVVAWREALRHGRKGGIERKAVQSISDLVIGRVQALEEETICGEEERLNVAVALLEAAVGVLRDVEKDEVLSSLVDALTGRGRWRLQQEDYQGATEDLRKAFDLYPDHVRIRDEFCETLIRYARDRIRAHQKTIAKNLLEQAANVAKAGLRKHPDSESLRIRLHTAQNELDVLEGKVSRDDGWAALEEALAVIQHQASSEDAPARNALGDLIQQAMNKKETGNYAGAVADLERALQLDAEYIVAKTIMIQTCREWAERLFNHAASTGVRGSLKEAKDIVKLGLLYDPDHLALRQMQEQIVMTEELLAGEAE